MTCVVSYVFHVIFFPYQHKMVTIDQLDYYMTDLSTNLELTIPFIGDSKMISDGISVGIFKYSSLMGTFHIPPPVRYIASEPISTTSSVVDSNIVPIQTTDFVDS